MADPVNPARYLPVLCPLLAASTPAAAATTSPVSVSRPVDAHDTPRPRSQTPRIAAAPRTPLHAGALAALLNHTYVTVDIGTYDAIRSSSFLKEQFAVYEERTTRRGDISYSAQYFYGDHTYLEIFNEQGRAKPQPYAIAFGVDGEGDAKKVAPTIGESPVTRFLGDEEIPWFKLGTLPREQSGVLITWIMEYYPEFLARWHNETGTAGGITRAAVLQRYAAVLGENPERKQLADIYGISMTLTAAELGDFAVKARDLGCTVERTKSGLVVRTGNEEIRVAAGGFNAITTLHFKLRTKVPAQELRLGSSVLSIKADKTASWTFVPVK